MRLRRALNCIAAAVVALGLGAPRLVDAEHFDVLLRAQVGKQFVEGYTDTTPPIGGLNKRPVLHVTAGAHVEVLWKMKSAYPHGVMKDITVRFFVVKEDALGQKPVPDVTEQNALSENLVTMDFQPGNSAAGMVKFTMPDSGLYLARVQSEGTQGAVHDHEHFAAVDIAVDHP